MSASVRQAAAGSSDYSALDRGIRLFGRSIGPDGQGLKVVAGRPLTEADDGRAVLLLPTVNYLYREAGVRVGDELRCLVPGVRRNQGIPDIIGIYVPGLGGPYLDPDNAQEATFKVVGLIDEPVMNEVVVVPLGTLQKLAGAEGLYNSVGLSAPAESALAHEAVSLGRGFYVVSPAFIAAPLVMQVEALTNQGRLLVLTFSLITLFVLSVLAVAGPRPEAARALSSSGSGAHPDAVGLHGLLAVRRSARRQPHPGRRASGRSGLRPCPEASRVPGDGFPILLARVGRARSRRALVRADGSKAPDGGVDQ